MPTTSMSHGHTVPGHFANLARETRLVLVTCSPELTVGAHGHQKSPLSQSCLEFHPWLNAHTHTSKPAPKPSQALSSQDLELSQILPFLEGSWSALAGGHGTFDDSTEVC